ncbi:MAG: two-component system, NarL family, response regulator NreC [Actinomycetota bacterium]|jgi:two-component system response regulator NreC
MTPSIGEADAAGELGVLLVDDHIVLREGLATLLDQQPDLRVVGQLVRAEDAVLVDLAPDVIVTGLERALEVEDTPIVRRLRSAFPSSGILVLTSNAHPAIIETALADGADGYVLKTSEADELLSGIRAVGSGRTYLQPSLGVMLARWRRSPPARVLSPREETVLVLVATGHTNAGIAEQLSTSVRTVETHRARVMQKLGRTTRAELFDYALGAGLINLPANGETR